MHTVAWLDSDGLEFNVLQTELIGGESPPTGGMADTMVARFNQMGAKVSRRKAKAGESSGDRLSVRAEGVSAEMMFVSAPRSQYMLSVQWRKPPASDLADDIERFFASFKIVARP